VAFIPVHRIILASFSSKFKKIFESEDAGGGLTEVPLVDYPNLKRVVNFIYDGQVTLHSEDEMSDFEDALVLLQVEVERTVTTMENTGKGELRVVDVKQMGMRTVEVPTSDHSESAGGESTMQDSSQDTEALRQEALSTLQEEGGRSQGHGSKMGGQRRGRSRTSEERNRSSPDRARKRRRSSAGEDEGSRNIGRRRKTSGGEGSREKRGGGRRVKRERKSTSSDFNNKRGRGVKEERREQNMKDEGHGRSKVEKRTKMCFFFQEDTCIKGQSCNFSHDFSREQLERRRDAKERREDPRAEVLYLQDKTLTLKTLDIEEHFSKDGDVVKVKFIGKQERGNLFKVVVPWYLVSSPGSSSYSFIICGVKVEVESKIGGSTALHEGGSYSESRSPSRRSPEWFGWKYDWKHRSRVKLWEMNMGRYKQLDVEKGGREAAEVDSKGETSSKRSKKLTEHSGDEGFPTCYVCGRVFNRGSSWRDNEQGRFNHMKNHDVGELREQKSPWEVGVDHGPQWQSWSEFRGQTANFEPHFLKGLHDIEGHPSRDLQNPNQDLPAASTLTESSVESFLKEVRSQVETSKVKEEGAEKEKEEVEEDIKGLVEEGNEVVPKEDMGALKNESKGDSASVKDVSEDVRDANQGGLRRVGEVVVRSDEA